MDGRSLTLLLRRPDSQIQTLTLDPSRTLTLSDLKLSLSLHPSFFFLHNGRALPDSTRLPSIPPLSMLSLCPRLVGGGGDGGATGAESRDCYLNMYAERKPDKVDPNEQRLSKWLNCSVSGEPLAPPCVVDRLGNLFNKEALVEALINRRIPKWFGHIKGLKDMVDVCLEPASGEKDGGSGVRFQCPVTGSEFNGKYRFFALRKCGHVLSAKALKEVKSSACLVCYKEFEEADKIVINGNEEDVAELRARMEEERAKGKEKKATKKGKNGEVGIGPDVENGARLSGKKHGIVDAKGVEKLNGKLEPNGKVEVAKGTGSGSSSAKRFKAVDIAPANANKEVYASIFTSSRKSEFKETYSCRSLPLGRN